MLEEQATAYSSTIHDPGSPEQLLLDIRCNLWQQFSSSNQAIFDELLFTSLSKSREHFQQSIFHQETICWMEEQPWRDADLNTELAIRGHLLITGLLAQDTMASSHYALLDPRAGLHEAHQTALDQYQLTFTFFMWLARHDTEWLYLMQPEQKAFWCNFACTWISDIYLGNLRNMAEQAHFAMLAQLVQEGTMSRWYQRSLHNRIRLQQSLALEAHADALHELTTWNGSPSLLTGITDDITALHSALVTNKETALQEPLCTIGWWGHQWRYTAWQQWLFLTLANRLRRRNMDRAFLHELAFKQRWALLRWRRAFCHPHYHVDALIIVAEWASSRQSYAYYHTRRYDMPFCTKHMWYIGQSKAAHYKQRECAAEFTINEITRRLSTIVNSLKNAIFSFKNLTITAPVIMHPIAATASLHVQAPTPPMGTYLTLAHLTYWRYWAIHTKKDNTIQILPSKSAFKICNGWLAHQQG